MPTARTAAAITAVATHATTAGTAAITAVATHATAMTRAAGETLAHAAMRAGAHARNIVGGMMDTLVGGLAASKILVAETDGRHAVLGGSMLLHLAGGRLHMLAAAGSVLFLVSCLVLHLILMVSQSHQSGI